MPPLTGLPVRVRVPYGLRRQSDSGDGAFERTRRLGMTSIVARTKAVSRCACHRSPKYLPLRSQPSTRYTLSFASKSLLSTLSPTCA